MVEVVAGAGGPARAAAQVVRASKETGAGADGPRTPVLIRWGLLTPHHPAEDLVSCSALRELQKDPGFSLEAMSQMTMTAYPPGCPVLARFGLEHLDRLSDLMEALERGFRVHDTWEVLDLPQVEAGLEALRQAWACRSRVAPSYTDGGLLWTPVWARRTLPSVKGFLRPAVDTSN